jgi:hypothetical protein
MEFTTKDIFGGESNRISKIGTSQYNSLIFRLKVHL